MSDVTKLEKALVKLTQEDADTGKILSAAERLLAARPNHTVALQCKAVCCMYSEKFGAAIATLDTLESTGGRLSRSASANAKFQRAYCLYRMRRYAEAKAVLTSTADGSLRDHTPSRHLLAQVHYNLEEFPAAAAIYKSLLDTGAYRDEDERIELETNYTAVLASGGEPEKAVATVQDAEEKTSDLVYNAATALMEAADFEGAMKMLRQAESLYAQENPKSRVRSLQEALALPDAAAQAEALGTQGTPGHRFLNDVANTWVQMAFVKYATHHEEEAAAILSLVLNAKPSSVVTAAVAAINWTAIRRNSDFVDASKKLKGARNAKVASRLTSKQNLIVRYNTALLHLNSGNQSSCKRLVDAMAKDHPESELTQSLRLVIAAREARGKKQQQQQGTGGGASSTEALVNDFIAKQSSSSGKLVPLIAVQVYLENNDVAKALEAFNAPALAEMANSPAGIATRTAWLCQLGRLADAAALVSTAVPGIASAGSQKALLAWAMHFFSTQEGDAGNAQVIALLKKVRAAVPALASDREVTAMLGLCLAMSKDAANLVEARRCLSAVVDTGSTSGGGSGSAGPSLSKKEIDALARKQPSRAAVEKLGYHRRTATSEADGGAGDADEQQQQQQGKTQGLKKRRARPMRHPPKVAPEKGKAPDPERWVPMSMRSYIKDLPARKKKELKRLRAQEQEQKRKAAERRKSEIAAAAADGATATEPAEAV